MDSNFENSQVNTFPVNKSKKASKIGRLTYWVIIIIALLGIYFSVYYYKQYNALRADPNLISQRETEELLASLNSIMELPKDETPTIATISDVEKLKDQPFFKNAQTGDKLLAFTKGMQAILYRPSIGKIIAVAPIVIDQNKQQEQPKTEEHFAPENQEVVVEENVNLESGKKVESTATTTKK